MASKIQTSLEKIFAQNRLVFWYDEGQELWPEYDALDLADVTKVKVKNNEFGVKYRVVREGLKQKFLLYFPYARPLDLNNWLLDLLLGNYEFRTNQAAIFLQELGLEYDLKAVVQDHMEFYKNKARVQALKDLLEPEDQESRIRVKMLSVVCRCEPDIELIALSLLDEMTGEETPGFSQIVRYGLESFLWECVAKVYGYYGDSPSMRDFLIELFNSNYAAIVTGEKPTLNKEALVLMNRWKDSVKYRSSFEKHSDALAPLLDVAKDLEHRQADALWSADLYQLIDQKVIVAIKDGLLSRTLPPQDVRDAVRRRESTHWYARYQHLYRVLLHAAEFYDLLDHTDLQLDSLKDGLRKYRNTWHPCDFHYRKFIYHHGRAGQSGLLSELADDIEKKYANNFLLPVNDRWQQFVDTAEEWSISGVISQRQFFNHHVKPYLDDQKKIFVIISDALRFEVASELMGRILQEDRFTAELHDMVACLPSYTQLGMAALLPHSTIAFKEVGDSLLVDGVNPQGTPSRSKILAAAVSGRAIAVKSADFLALNTKTEGRSLMKENDVVYIYHNTIDARGDKRETEGQVFEAVEQALEEIIALLRKITNINGTNVLITADHGFLYQNAVLDESDFAEVSVPEKVTAFNRRFVVGANLADQAAARKFSAKALGLEGEQEFLIAKSINRFRLKGAGSRYVHGGASLQEICLPVIEFNKKRSSDVNQVEVDVVRTTSQITASQITISFYQQQPAAEKRLSRELRVALYSKDGVLISDAHSLAFDFTEDDSRVREKKVTFVLSRKADEFNGQDVVLRLQEPIEGTTHFRLYKEFNYTLRKSFASDFDDF